MSEHEGVVRKVLVAPLYRVYWGRRKNRAKRAVRILREFIARHAKVDKSKHVDRVIIDNEVNKLIWSKGIEKPPRRITVEIEINKKDRIAIVRPVKEERQAEESSAS